MKTCSAKRSKVKNNTCKTDPIKLKKNISLWKNQDEFYVDDTELKIEDFEDETPLNISETESPQVKQPVVEKLDEIITVEPTQQLPAKKLFVTCTKKDKESSKSLLTCVTSFQNNFKGVDIQKDLVDSTDESGEESEADIQQEATQESVVSAGVQIDCSTSPNTKSTQVDRSLQPYTSPRPNFQSL